MHQILHLSVLLNLWTVPYLLQEPNVLVNQRRIVEWLEARKDNPVMLWVETFPWAYFTALPWALEDYTQISVNASPCVSRYFVYSRGKSHIIFEILNKVFVIAFTGHTGKSPIHNQNTNNEGSNVLQKGHPKLRIVL